MSRSPSALPPTKTNWLSLFSLARNDCSEIGMLGSDEAFEEIISASAAAARWDRNLDRVQDLYSALLHTLYIIGQLPLCCYSWIGSPHWDKNSGCSKFLIINFFECTKFLSEWRTTKQKLKLEIFAALALRTRWVLSTSVQFALSWGVDKS